MTEDPLGVTPTRREPRGDFPPHEQVVLPVLPLEIAAEFARVRLAEWRRAHGH